MSTKAWRLTISTSDDRIFVYFSDHGSTGLIAFPVGRLTAKRLNEALLTMHKQHRFKQLVFYLEACESGSMFKDILRKNINETLDEQYQFVRDVTEGSHVMNYGNLSIANEPVGWFLGTKNPYMKSESSKPKHKKVLWPSRDVELMHLEKIKLLHPQSAAVDLEISRIKKNRNDIEALFKNLIDFLVTEGSERRLLLEKRSSVENLDCHDEVVEAFDSICIDIDKHDYALKYMNVLNNLCTKFNDPAKIINAMRTICLKTHSQLI
ncbi:peptidase C13 family protein [Cooperia oncophora]